MLVMSFEVQSSTLKAGWGADLNGSTGIAKPKAMQ